MGCSAEIKRTYYELLSKDVLCMLLKDRSSNKNIIWATDDYMSMGDGYKFGDSIEVDKVWVDGYLLVKSRIEKGGDIQVGRVKVRAEVFTPLWMCNKQNNLVDSAWFGREDVFNVESDRGWSTIHSKVDFSNICGWEQYIRDIRLEICCGEAPYLVSRYDVVSGIDVDIRDRVGLLDRKLRVIKENVGVNINEWYGWVIRAYKSIYGFEWAGDNLLLARINMLFTFIDYYVDVYGEYPKQGYLLEIADIISYNIWQMDGLKYVIPKSCEFISEVDNYLYGGVCSGCVSRDNLKHVGTYCVIKDWDKDEMIEFASLVGVSYV